MFKKICLDTNSFFDEKPNIRVPKPTNTKISMRVNDPASNPKIRIKLVEYN